MFQMKQMKGGDFESSLVISYILAFLIGLPTSVHETVHTPAVWLVIILLGVIQTGLATICLSRGLDAVPPVTAALTSGIEPILNPVLAAIICGETIGPDVPGRGRSCCLFCSGLQSQSDQTSLCSRLNTPICHACSTYKNETKHALSHYPQKKDVPHQHILFCKYEQNR